MNFFRIQSAFFVIACFFCSALAGASERTSLTIGIVQEWNQFNPVNSSLASTAALSHFVQRQMVNRDEKGMVIPEVATQIPTLKNKKVKIQTINGKKKVVAEWEIQSSAVWGDGKPITCEDWKLGWQVGLSENVSASDRGSYSKIEKMECDAKKPRAAILTYATDEWTFDRDLPPLLPAHLESAVFEKWKNQKEAYDQNSIFVKEPTNPGLYNGPYLVKEFKLGSHIVFELNPKFAGPAAKIPRIVVKHIGDTKTLRANLETKQLDVISSIGFPPDLAMALANESANSKLSYKVVFRDSPIFQGIFFNMEDPVLKDPKVREALAKAIDKEELSQAFFRGRLKPAHTFIPMTNPAFVQKKSEFSLSEAKKILENSGWKVGPSGVRQKNGQNLSVVYRTSAGILVLETIQTYICSQLKKIGAECSIKNQPPRVLLGDTVSKGDFSMVMFGWPVATDSSLRGQFASTEIPTKENSWTGQNSLRWRSATVDRIVKSFDQEWSYKKRLELVRELDREIQRDRPMVPLYHRREAVVLPSSLQGFENDFSGTGFSYPERWHFEPILN